MPYHLVACGEELHEFFEAIDRVWKQRHEPMPYFWIKS